MDGNTDHPTAEDIFKEIKKKYPTVSFATVYNTLQALKDRREIVEVKIDSERRHYDPNPDPHHHILCNRCKKIVDIFVDYSKTLKLPKNITDEFSLSEVNVNFYGICRDCRDKT